eukprot:6199345-Pleurochrysis_carterae.AAC.1
MWSCRCRCFEASFCASDAISLAQGCAILGAERSVLHLARADALVHPLPVHRFHEFVIVECRLLTAHLLHVLLQHVRKLG